MKTDLKQPCRDIDCPFLRTCQPGWLGRARAEEIAAEVFEQDKNFACHKTTREGLGNAYNREEEQHCAGAMILAEKLERPNQWMRWMERLGFYDPAQLKMDADVFDDVEEFIEHHRVEKQEKRKTEKQKQ